MKILTAAIRALGPSPIDKSIISRAVLVTFNPNDTIVKEGIPSDKIYLITKGKCNISCKQLSNHLKRDDSMLDSTINQRHYAEGISEDDREDEEPDMPVI